MGRERRVQPLSISFHIIGFSVAIRDIWEVGLVLPRLFLYLSLSSDDCSRGLNTYRNSVDFLYSSQLFYISASLVP